MGYTAVPHSIPSRPNQPGNTVFPSTASKSGESTYETGTASKHWSLFKYPSTGVRVESGQVIPVF